MRALALALILSVPLAAGEKSELAQAVDKFGSDRAAVREAASRSVQRLLSKTLAPLLEAMRSSDPEVARRARRAFASMLPAEKKEAKEEPQSAGAGQVIIIGGQNRQQIRFVLNKGKGGAFQLVQFPGGQQNEDLKKFGVEGTPVTDTLLRKQLGLALGRGFAINRVAGGTPAAALGLQQHDVVLMVNGRPVQRAEQFVKALGDQRNWKTARARVLRMGTLRELGGR